MPKPKKHPTVSRVREVFDYDPTTGVMTRKVRLGNNGQAGKVVGSDGKQGYLYVSLDHGRYLLHRIAWAHYHGEWPSQVIDHIDGNGYNNAIRNLRDVAHRANSANMLRNKSMRADAAKWRAYQESLTVAEPVKVVSEAVNRITAFIERRKQMRGLDQSVIAGLDGDGYALLTDDLLNLLSSDCQPAQPAANILIDFDQIGTAGPFPVVDGSVTVPAVTVLDLVRMAQPAASVELPDFQAWWEYQHETAHNRLDGDDYMDLDDCDKGLYESCWRAALRTAPVAAQPSLQRNDHE